MTVLHGSWVAVLAIVCVVWLVRHKHIWAARHLRPPLNSRMYADASRELPAIGMLVAAKDEAANIESCLRSLIDQDYPELKLIAIDDRSTDGTGDIIDRLAGESPGLSAVHVQVLQSGWFGKNNAMREGVAQTREPWLCFTDADCVQTSPRSLTVAMRYALEQGADLLSILPTIEAHSFWERVIQPACGAIMMIWFNPTRVNDPRRANAYANGAFMLMRRSCYDAIGGHAAVRTEVNEDMHMARRTKEAGLRLIVVSNDDLYHVRMYDTLGKMWSGWSRIFYGCFETYRRLIISSLAVVVFSLLSWLSLAAGVAGWESDSGFGRWAPWIAGASLAACLAQVSVMARFYRLSRIHPAYALLYPVGVTIALGALFNAMRRLHGRAATVWRGTTYRGDQVEGDVERAGR
ncbi:MAG: glycosyltransferase [Phycisphaerae bacterium]